VVRDFAEFFVPLLFVEARDIFIAELDGEVFAAAPATATGVALFGEFQGKDGKGPIFRHDDWYSLFDTYTQSVLTH